MTQPGETMEFNKTQNKEIWLSCGSCFVETCHKVSLSIDLDGSIETHDVDYSNSYQIVQCQGCKGFSFRQCSFYSEPDGFDDELGENVYYTSKTENLYPSRVAGRRELNSKQFLPVQVKIIYEETLSALSNKLQVLAGIGIRALIETVCKDKQSVGKNLEARIDSLVTLGVLTCEGAEILHSLRILGNEAAHEVKPHSESKLGTAMDVVEHLLSGVYILPTLSKNLPKRS